MDTTDEEKGVASEVDTVAYGAKAELSAGEAADTSESAPDIEAGAEKSQIGEPRLHAVEALERVTTTASRTSRRSRASKAQENIVREVYPETDLEKRLVGWEGQDDPLHPRNLPDSRKWTLLGFVSGITFLSPLCSSVIAPGIPIMNEELHNTSSILSTLTVSIFLFGFAVGPLILSPLSEIYGRQSVLNFSNAFLAVWQIGCALAPDIGSLIAFRFLGGLGGSGCLAIGGGVIADLFPVQQRGLANAIFVLGPLFGPVIGPIIGGFIAERAGWRWVYWVLLIACCIFSIGFFILGKETNAAVLIRTKTRKMRKETGMEDLQSAYDVNKSAAELKPLAVLRRSVVRPFRMLFSSPILPLLSLYLSFIFSLIYLIFTTVTVVFIETYHWQDEICGLAYLGVGLGFMMGMVAVAKTSDPMIVRLTKANKGVYQPEMRLATCLFFAFFIPISFFWYGWSADKHTHWIIPIIGLIPFGFGAMGIFSAIQTYFIDATTQYAASAVAGLTAIRCIFGTFIPLAGPYMYASLGLGWGNSLLGFVALGLIPAPLLIYVYGARLRGRWPIRAD